VLNPIRKASNPLGKSADAKFTFPLEENIHIDNEDVLQQKPKEYDKAEPNYHTFSDLNRESPLPLEFARPEQLSDLLSDNALTSSYKASDKNNHFAIKNYPTDDTDRSDINSIYSSHSYEDDDFWSESICSMSDLCSEDFSDDDISLPEHDDDDILPILGELPFAGCISPLPFGRLSDRLNRSSRSTSTNTNLQHPYKDMVRLFRNSNKERDVQKKSRRRVAFKMPATPPASPINRRLWRKTHKKKLSKLAKANNRSKVSFQTLGSNSHKSGDKRRQNCQLPRSGRKTKKPPD
jgi:hypothetical protein